MAEPDELTTLDATRTVTQTEIDGGPSFAPPDAPALEQGELVDGRYRVVRLVGRGGYGEVYEVTDTRLSDRPLALKLHRLRRLSRTALEALKSEFALLATLSHPNLATVYDFAYVESEYAFFTQSLIAGIPLSRAGIDPVSDYGAHLLAQLCRALDYLHSRAIVHGDVKPGNILVDEDEDRLVLLDFGIARALGDSMGTRVVGSPPYMAPELITGGVSDGRTDLYALGVTLYQLVTGRVPFRGTSTQVMMAHVDEPPPDLPPSVPLPLQALIARLIAKDPERRPQHAGAVLEALSRIAKVELELDTQQTLASHVLSAPLVGRDAELDHLLSRAAHPSADEPLLLVGEGGTGKSRLIRELRQRVQLRGQSWSQVQAPRSAGSLLVELARALLGPRQIEALSDDERIELARALPELRRKRERLAVPIDPDLARARRLAILGGLIARRFADNGGVLAIEDLHWADPLELTWLAEILEHAREGDAACFVLMATRPGLDAAKVAELGARALPCGELSEEASRALLEAIFGDADVVAETALGARIREAPSSALWLQESLRLAIERGVIVREAGSFTAARDVEAQPLADVLAARVAELPRDARSVALGSAVLAQASSSAELCKVAGMKPHRATAALAELVHRGIVERLTEGPRRARYAMHDRYADVVLQALPERRVRAARRRAGRWLARRDKKDFRGLGRASDELIAAGDEGRALRVLARAADLAEQAGRPEQAAEFLRREVALRRDRAEVDPGRVERLFDVAFACGRSELVDDAIERLRETLDHAPTPANRVGLELRRARRALRSGDTTGAETIAHAALLEAEDGELDGLACELVILLSKLDYAHGTLASSLARAEDAATRARGLERRDLETEAELHSALMHVRFGSGKESTAAAQRAVAAAKREADPKLLAEAHRMLGNAHFVASRRGKALRSYRRAVKAARKCGSTEAEAKALNNVGICAHSAGQVREALAAWRRAIVLKERVGATASALLTYGSMSGVLNILGETDEARRAQERVISAKRADARPSTALAWGNRGDTEVLSGDLERALEAYERGAALYREAGMTSLRTHALAGRTRSLLIRRAPGDFGQAGTSLEELRGAQEEVSSREEHRRYLTTLALWLDVQGEHEAALKHARAAARIKKPDTVYEDVFGSAVEARWTVALILQRLGQEAKRDRAMTQAQELLARRAKALDREEDRPVFLEGHPLHRAVIAGHLEPTPGCTWIRQGSGAWPRPPRAG